MTTNENDRIRAARNAYARKWRANNPDKVKAAQDRYWNRVAERMEQEEIENFPTEVKEND